MSAIHELILVSAIHELIDTNCVCVCVKNDLELEGSLTRAKLEQPETSRTAIALDVFSRGEHFWIYFADNLVVSVHFPCLFCRDVENNFALHAPHLSPSTSSVPVTATFFEANNLTEREREKEREFEERQTDSERCFVHNLTDEVINVGFF